MNTTIIKPGVNLSSLLFIGLLVLSFLFLFLFVVIKPTFAAITIYWDVSPPANAQIRPASECLSAGAAYAECANSHNDGNCGLADCAEGYDWTKYQLTCTYDPTRGEYKGYYQQGGRVYSIGNKCISGPYLNPGYCTSAYGGPVYRTCCNADGSLGGSCVLSGAPLDDGIYPL